MTGLYNLVNILIYAGLVGAIGSHYWTRGSFDGHGYTINQLILTIVAGAFAGWCFIVGLYVTLIDLVRLLG